MLKSRSRKTSLTRLVSWSLSALVVLSMLAAALPQPAQAASTDCEETYVVKAGEGIRRIAKEYSIPVYRLARANDLEFPYALTTGMKLCIPGEPTVSSSIKLTVTNTSDKIKIDGTGFKKNNSFFIKVRENDTSRWYKISSASSDRFGDLSDSFTLPKDLRGKASVVVCLKDAVSDALICRKVYRL